MASDVAMLGTEMDAGYGVGFKRWLAKRIGLVVSWGKVVAEGKWRSDTVEEGGESLSGFSLLTADS